ncbi:hypothetical protein CTAYLR_005347 [Chrysophaeum taylorii]|uniref:DNA topoisomerase 2 n=1 Tax=Chrysophaeum taylorii TaxID=2483200 RepID=A0AAD7U741_9STRA|nr:hypothetical protein CTAYLR_005347 [Chrysophaeum taylorii]
MADVLIYQKKTQLEHILLRPDTYVGSIEKLTQAMWVLDPSTKRIVNRQITYVPGLFKIFDEIIVNAADNKQRDESMTTIRVTIDREANRISVMNDGKGIPVEKHAEHGCYVAELIFGHLLTGSNFDDDEKKTTGGRNGYGAKLANIFSTEFVVETEDSNVGKKLTQTWRDNMSSLAGPAVIAPYRKKKDSTCVTFVPDLKRFKMDSLDDDIVALLSKRAYDVASSAACHGGGIAVYLNGDKVPVKSFEDFVALHDGLEPPAAFEKTPDGSWAVGVAPSDGSFQQLSFVNSICTTKGGTHVAVVADQVASRLAAAVKRKNKGQEVKPAIIKSHLAIYVDALVVNPAFDSQTKETLTTRASQLGSKCELSDKFFKAIEKSGVVDRVVAWNKFKQDEQLKRKTNTSKRSRLTGITKLDDANCAGGAKSRDCTLILTEGDSAKALAVSGLGVVGRDLYGVFPLKGKPLNVREASHAAIMKNEEIQHIVQIMGLRFGVEYDAATVKNLRYGHLMIMTDQDHDGSHIKGLLINCLHHFWPSLLKLPNFLRVFITPIVKATPRSSRQGESRTFFTLPEYEEWKASLGPTGASSWTIKYYKGLGTSTSKEAKEYFSALDTHRIDFEPMGRRQSDDLAHDSDLIDMAFSKKRVDDRKLWLRAFEPGTFLDYSVDALTYSDFINRELVLFSLADNQRSIPCVVDGFKPSQRKVLFACFKRKLKREIKVAQLAGYVSEHAAYHHGEASLVGTIVGMAQDFVGSNNLNLLTPSGQFGTRIMGGKDAASPRYIFTKLEPIARAVFHPDDDAVLDYLDDDGQSIEPNYYVPVLPLALCNGADGIGTGWATSVPNYDPRAIIAELRGLIDRVGSNIDDDSLACAWEDHECSLEPAYRGFNGEVIRKQGGSFACHGHVERLDDTTVLVDELPVRKWTHDYKLWLEAQIVGSEKEVAWVKDFKENHTDTTVSFTVTVIDPKSLDDAENALGGLKTKFKLVANLATSNMNFFDHLGAIVKYDQPRQILSAFYKIRYETYVKRKTLLVSKLEEAVRILQNKVRFVLAVVEGQLVVHNRKRSELLAELQQEGYYLVRKTTAKTIKQSAGDEDDEDDERARAEEDDPASGASGAEASLASGYDYLLSQKIWALTMERVRALRRELADQEAGLTKLKETPETQLWLDDLEAVEHELDASDKAREEDAKADLARRPKAAAKRAPRKRAPAPKKKPDVDAVAAQLASKVVLDDVESDNMSDDDNAPVPKKPPAQQGRKRVSKKTTQNVLEANIHNTFSPAKAPASPVVKKSRAAAKPKAAAAPPKAAPAKKPPAPKKPPAKKPPPKKEEIIDVDSDSDAATVELEKKTPRPTRATRDKKKPVYVVVDDDDSDENDGKSGGDKDDDDDEDFDDL